MLTRKKNEFISWFKDISIKDVPLVGGKNASLGEMYQFLTKKGVRIPNGFAISAHAYFYLLHKADIEKEIRAALKGLNTKNIHDLQKRGHLVRSLILSAKFPIELEEEIISAYRLLEKEYGHAVDVAVRSSATAEDLPDASFAGQQETYLNIRGKAPLFDACRKCFASLFTNRAISYREDKHFDHFKIGLSIGVQKMIRSDLASSGVMFSLDTESGFRDVVVINASYGLGEMIVQGAVTPDEYIVHKPPLAKGFRPILSKNIGEKKVKMIYATNGNKPTKVVHVSEEDRRKMVLNDEEILALSKWAMLIEKHYSEKRKTFTPMDMEWAKDGKTGKLFIVQARPETVQSQRDYSVLEEYILKETGNLLVSGASVGSRIGVGKVHVIQDVAEIDRFREGEILATDMTDPDWEPIMKIASAIVTNRGGRTCHAAIISRELGIPCVVGTQDATKKLKNKKMVTVSCAEGERGNVYDRKLKFEIRKTDLKKLPRPKRVKLMMNIGSPDIAFTSSFIPNDGVGLAREEFIITSSVRIHPLALVHFDTLKDKTAKREIEKLTEDYKDKKQYFVDKLAEGVATIGAAFYPKDVIFRLSDFKTNEYASLLGGAEFEPKEDNPMIGWRGASRYYDPKYKDGFLLECLAFKKVRNEMGLKNIKLMIPFCRTPEEAKKVLDILSSAGLKRGRDGLEIYVMVEIPSNILLAEEFAKFFDGFSIGSNDLTQLTLGVDRDSELVSHVYDERNPAVEKFIHEMIRVAKKHRIKIGICGQGPSDHPDFARFLVKEGIDSLSLNPDTIIKTTLMILEMEK